jgi:multimeric flavodoxin WrbA
MMNVLVVNGSPHGKNGNTYTLQEAFVRGASTAGAKVEEVFLNTKKIKPCLGCYTCWVKTPGTCILKDDQAELLEKCRTADTLVLATPLYVDGMTAQTKTFVDRLIPLAKPEFILSEGHCRHPSAGHVFKNFVLISNCGFHELDNFDALVMHCNRICLNMHAQYLGHLLRPHGPLLKFRDLMPESIDAVLAAATKAGTEVATTGKLSQATMDAVSADLIPKDVYVEVVNSHWLQEMKNAGLNSPEKH